MGNARASDLPLPGDYNVSHRAGIGERLCTVARDVAALQGLLGATFVVPLAVSLLYGEWYNALSFLLAMAGLLALGGGIYRVCRHAREPDRRQAMIIAAVGWLASAASGGLPLLIAAYITPSAVAQAFVPAGQDYPSSLMFFRNPLHALFEGMSAFTTTGLTMAVHEPSIGHGMLFYRCFAQWIGGAGVIVLALAILPRPQVAGALELYQSETAGAKIRPSIIGTARAIWKTYCVLTLLVTVYLFAMTLIILPHYGVVPALFDSVSHAMAAQSTGGFSTLDDSIAGYGSYAMEMVYIPPMILGTISLPLYYTIGRSRYWRGFIDDAQCRFMWLMFAIFIPLQVLLLWHWPTVSEPFRVGVFQVVSGLSTTGWQTSDIGKWSSSAVFALACGPMIVGGAAGATVGGIKLIRGYLCSQAVIWRVRQLFVPEGTIVPFRIGPQPITSSAMQREVGDAAIFCVLYMAILVASVILAAYLLGPDVPLANVVLESVSSQSTVGLSAGITDPGMPPSVEALFIFQMWIGRLEIFPLIVLFTSLFTWKRSR